MHFGKIIGNGMRTLNLIKVQFFRDFFRKMIASYKGIIQERRIITKKKGIR